MQEKVEIITNHFEHYWTKIPKNGYCAVSMYYNLPCKEVFGECVQDIDTEAKISFADRDVHTDYLIFVRFMYL